MCNLIVNMSTETYQIAFLIINNCSRLYDILVDFESDKFNPYEIFSVATDLQVEIRHVETQLKSTYSDFAKLFTVAETKLDKYTIQEHQPPMKFFEDARIFD